METEELLERLEEQARGDGEHGPLFGAAAEQIRDQQSRIESLTAELEETNEGMVALTVELQEAEQRYRSLFEEAVEGIYKTTPDARRYRMANQSLAEILGYDDPEQLQQSVSVEDVFVDPQRYETYRSTLQREGELEDFEYRVRRADGSIRWVTDNVRAITDQRDQPSYRGGVVDITERKEYETRLEERNEALEALNRVVRHDIGNDVQAVATWAQQLTDHVEPEGRDALERVRRKADSIAQITREAAAVLETLTDETVELDAVALEPVLTDEIERQRTSHPNATFAVTTEIPYVQVRANEMLGSVFRNVLTNAIVHNDSAEPRVEITCKMRDETVLVSIADNGPGIDDDQAGAIFEKGVQSIDSDGTGIGLFLVDYLLDAYGGSVQIEDADGVETAEPTVDGAMFVLEFERVE
ncbi:sensor histidine kinase [Halovenus marina]|uniref:sensor histidine kinase n=1 Tax=Halovenus marina TaxID=3396621 RepID=UPI003F54BDFC